MSVDKKYYYITTPIYYVNDKPHVGHAYTSVAADTLARFKRLDGYDVRFLTGTDEHGQKVEKSAAKAGKSPQDFVDEVSQSFQDLAKALDLSNDIFMRTTSDAHKKAATELWNRIEAAGYIYKGSYAGWYSVRDEAYYGEEVQRLPRSNGDVKVMVKYPLEQRRNLSSLNNFRVRTVDGREVPLLSVVEVELSNGAQRIQRRDGERFIRVRADMDHDLMGDITKDVTDNFIPELEARYPGLEVLKGGQQEEEEEFFNEILALYAVALFMMYALIAIAFHSYWLPLLVMTAIPFGFMGAIFGHLIFGVPMAMFSWFGIGAAAGVVVNDNLVLVDYIGRLREQGKSLRESIVEAGVTRFRPILLTTVTTFVGLIPIMSEKATNAQFLKPAVLSLAFGVLFALFVTLLMVPALYAIGGDLAHHPDSAFHIPGSQGVADELLHPGFHVVLHGPAGAGDLRLQLCRKLFRCHLVSVLVLAVPRRLFLDGVVGGVDRPVLQTLQRVRLHRRPDVVVFVHVAAQLAAPVGRRQQHVHPNVKLALGQQQRPVNVPLDNVLGGCVDCDAVVERLADVSPWALFWSSADAAAAKVPQILYSTLTCGVNFSQDLASRPTHWQQKLPSWLSRWRPKSTLSSNPFARRLG